MLWLDKAACRGHGELFFADKGDNSKVERAIAICRVCPVVDECFADSVVNEFSPFIGVKAGMKPKDRARVVIRVRRENGKKG